jgi:hypothetical protein
MKKCFKCGEAKPLSEFYKHKMMADGHLNKCKECNKRDVRKNRKDKIEYYREYDRARGNRQGYEYVVEFREKFPNKHRAYSMVNRAVRSGKLHKEPCRICGDTNVHAHHYDYAKPLNVMWLCPTHHKEWHKHNGPGANG